MSRRSLLDGLRWISVAALPALLLALYFTYSRGGLLALLVAGGCLLALSHDRLWLLATLAIGALGAVPAVLAVQARHSLADNIANPAAVDQGVTVLLLLLAGIALALLLFAGLRRLEGRSGGLTGRAVELSRNPVVLKRVALGAALVAIGVGDRGRRPRLAPVLQPRPPVPEPTRAALQPALRRRPPAISGGWRSTPSTKSRCSATAPAPTSSPGTSCARSTMPVHDAHSLYLEAFAELGLVGGLLVLALVGTLLWFGFAAWRGARAGAAGAATRPCSR